MIRYRLKKDLKNIGKAGTVATWSLKNQHEYAHLFGLLDKWPEIFNDYFEEIKEEPKEVFTWDGSYESFRKDMDNLTAKFNVLSEQWKQSHQSLKPDSKERIEVVFYEDKTKRVYPNSYFAATSKPIPSNKFIEINKAIESVLNNVEFHHIPGFTMETIRYPIDKLYTQQDIDKAREDAFNAAREYVEPKNDILRKLFGLSLDELLRNGKYPTLESYLNTLK